MQEGGFDAKITIENLTAGYGKREILHNLTLNMQRRAVTAIIGPNGSGKSTLLKAIVGIVKPRAGKILFEGEDISCLRPDKVLRKGIAMVPQGRKVFAHMTVLENLETGGYTIENRDLLEDRLQTIYNIFSVLAERKKQTAGTLSGGEQMQLCLARASILKPRVLLLDEPSLGLSPKLIAAVYDKLEEISQTGIPMVAVEQNVRKVLTAADYVYVLDRGTVRFQGESDALLADDAMVRRYMGMGL